jgi:two-component system sensor histidine kinase/response regulator
MKKNEFPGSSILIVDDNPRNLEVLGKTLENQHYNVEFAVDGTAALEWTDNKMFDLILLDVMMPGINGFQVCKNLRQNPKFRDIPIIFLTAETDKKNVVTGLEVGAQDYVTKPFSTQELLARVSTQLELKHTREELESVNKCLEEKVRERTRQLQEANEQLLSLDNAKAEFLRIISHEIRTPLNGILGPLQLLKQRSGTDEFNDLINILDISVARLEKFSMAALTITSLRTKKYRLQKQPVAMVELIDNSLDELKEKIQQKDLSITRKTDSEETIVEGEFELLRLCLINILLNAIKYSDKGGEIQVQILKNDTGVSCRVTDNGPGFSEEALQGLFKLFAPGEPHINDNVGLDLALVKMIMDAHNGKIDVANNPEGGATIELQFRSRDV